MKITIVNKDSTDRFSLENEKVEIETDGELWKLETGDTITDTHTNGRWNNERVKVEGFEFEKERLWGTIEGEKDALGTNISNGLILLERLGHKFKVRDKVRYAKTNPTKSLRLLEGVVIVIDPRLSNKSMPYLVFFPKLDSSHVIAEKMPCGYDQPWFSKKHATFEVYKQALWCGEVGNSRIEFIS